MNTLDVVVGGQYGSEAKGHVTAQVIQAYREQGRPVLNIRVAGPNAGHSVVDDSGTKFALRTIPVGAVWPDVKLLIAAGSEVDIDVLWSEIHLLESYGHDIRGRLFIDLSASVLEPHHIFAEGEAGLVSKVGSTGKGIGAVRADRIMRRATTLRGKDAAVASLVERGVRFIDTGEYPTLGHFPTGNLATVIEGTQGYGLGLHQPCYPQVTSSDCRAIDFLAMAGISPWDPFAGDLTVWVVARMYPIRVAGNSGPMEGETTWQELGLPEELTTVTKKVRRVGAWDERLLVRAVDANGGAKVKIALTMIDQKFPNLAGERLMPDGAELFEPELTAMIERVEAVTGAPVGMLTTSDRDAIWRR